MHEGHRGEPEGPPGEEPAVLSPRAFPMPVWPVEGRPARWCRWCGDAITRGRLDRSWHDGREDEPNCAYEFRLHTRRDDQFAYVEDRDGLKCWDCGESPEKWVRDVCETGMWRPFIDRKDPRIEWVGTYHGIRRATALEMEHSAPLWSVAHLPDAERRFYFGPENLRLRCPGCHTAKTRREAGDRGKMKRLEKVRLEGPRETRQKLQGGNRLPGKGQGQKLQGRGFSGSRPMQSRNDLRRR